MKIGLAQINPTVGDIEGNARLITAAIDSARRAGAEIVAVPELAILGYPPKDLLLKRGLVARCEQAVRDIAADCTDIAAIIGSPRSHTSPTGRGLHNSAALCRSGRIELWYDKRLLPTYDVFDESRYFDPGRQAGVFEHRGRLIGLAVCEDFWNDETIFQRRLYAEDTVSDLLGCGVELVINISASPFVVGKPEFRRQLFGRIASRLHGPVALVNQVGGNDDLVFDGYSMVLGSDGGLIAAARGFAEDLLLVDLPTDQRRDFESDDLADLFDALVLGVRDYMRKCGFAGSIVALSGGIDSAIVAAIARAALGPDAVRGVGMPSRFSSPGSIDDARDLADRLGIRFDLLPIEPVHESMLQLVKPLFDETGQPPGVAEENIQARIRGNVVMSLSNKTGALLLTTGNKSELAVGYCTLYGDMAGGLAVISDVPKTTVYKLARWMNEHPQRCGLTEPPIPESTITKAPSAELRPDQTDQDTLPPYDVLDEIILRYVERCDDVDRIIEETKIDADLVRNVCRMIDRNEYKRRQMPVGLKVTGRAFGSGWRMPIAARGV
ncbi:MAG: NAD+ synthase [Phycisphaerales bacterium]|nr:NAD+ synthase [Phycisphaerales bacterium]